MQSHSGIEGYAMTYNDLLDLLLATGEVVYNDWPERPMLWTWQRMINRTRWEVVRVDYDGVAYFGDMPNVFQKWRLN